MLSCFCVFLYPWVCPAFAGSLTKRPFRRYAFYRRSENPVWRDFFHIYQLQKKGEFIFMKKLSYYLKQHIPGYLFAILSMVIAVSLDLLSPQVTRHIVDDVLVGGQMGKLKYLLLAILLIGIGRCIFSTPRSLPSTKSPLPSPQTCAAIYSPTFSRCPPTFLTRRAPVS